MGGGRWRGAISGRWDHWATTIPHRRTPPPGTDEQRRSRRRGRRSLAHPASPGGIGRRREDGTKNARRNHLKRSNRVARRHCCRLAAVVGAGTTGLATRRLRSPGSKTEIALGACPLVHWPLRARRTIASAPLAGKGVIHELRGMPAKSSTKFRPTRPGCGQLPPSSWRPTAIPAGAARRQRCPSAATFARPPCSPRRGLPPAARYGREASL